MQTTLVEVVANCLMKAGRATQPDDNIATLYPEQATLLRQLVTSREALETWARHVVIHPDQHAGRDRRDHRHFYHPAFDDIGIAENARTGIGQLTGAYDDEAASYRAERDRVDNMQEALADTSLCARERADLEAQDATEKHEDMRGRQKRVKDIAERVRHLHYLVRLSDNTPKRMTAPFSGHCNLYLDSPLEMAGEGMFVGTESEATEFETVNWISGRDMDAWVFGGQLRRDASREATLTAANRQLDGTCEWVRTHPVLRSWQAPRRPPPKPVSNAEPPPRPASEDQPPGDLGSKDKPFPEPASTDEPPAVDTAPLVVIQVSEAEHEWIAHRNAVFDSISINDENKVLWLHGPAGTGKTTMAAWLVQGFNMTFSRDLDIDTAETERKRMPAICHFFSSTVGESRSCLEDPVNAVRQWIVHMLRYCSEAKAAWSLIRRDWDHKQTWAATREDVMKLFLNIVVSVEPCTFILDGLDQCTRTAEGSARMTEFLFWLRGVFDRSSSRLLIISRDEETIRRGLMTSPPGGNVFPEDMKFAPVQECALTPEDTHGDAVAVARDLVKTTLGDNISHRARYGAKIEDNAKAKGKEVPGRDQKNEEVKDLSEISATGAAIADALASRCNGNFLWLPMWTWLLGDELGNPETLADTLDTIQNAPVELHSAYELAWSKILRSREKPAFRLAVEFFRWAVCVAPRGLSDGDNLTMAAIRDAVFLDGTARDFSPPSMVPGNAAKEETRVLLDDAFSLCGPFVYEHQGYCLKQLGSSERYLAVLHHTARDFLIRRLSMVDAGVDSTAGYAPVTTPDTTCDRESSEKERRASSMAELDKLEARQHAVLASRCLQCVSTERAWRRELAGRYLVDSVNSMPASKNRPKAIHRPTIVCYAAMAWPVHVARSRGEARDVYLPVAKRLFTTPSPAWTHWQRHFDPHGMSDMDRPESIVSEWADEVVGEQRPMYNPVYYAAMLGVPGIIEYLVKERGHSPNETTSARRSPLMAACFSGNVAIVKELLAVGVSVDQSTYLGWCPLHAAIEHGHNELARFLIEDHSAHLLPSAVDDRGMTPLHVATFRQNREIVHLLLSRGADPSPKTRVNSWTPLFIAARNGDQPLMRRILQAELEKNGRQADSPLLFPSIAESKHGIRRFATPLAIAAAGGHLHVLEYAASLGVDFSLRFEGETTPLMMASLCGHIDIVKFLLNRNPGIDSRDHLGCTALHWAVLNGLDKIAILLLDHGANARTVSTEDVTLIHAAACCKDKDLAERLARISYMDLNSCSSSKWSAMDYADHCGDQGVINVLAKRVSYPRKRSSQPYSPLVTLLPGQNFPEAGKLPERPCDPLRLWPYLNALKQAKLKAELERFGKEHRAAVAKIVEKMREELQYQLKAAKYTAQIVASHEKTVAKHKEKVEAAKRDMAAAKKMKGKKGVKARQAAAEKLAALASTGAGASTSAGASVQKT